MKKLLFALLLVVSLLVGCSHPPPITTTTTTSIKTSILWSDAINHVGERTTVYGAVMGTTYASSSKGQPTFINVGKNYPDPARFTVLIWGSARSKFSPAPEIQYKGKTIYVYGLIELYNGGAEIIVSSPSQITTK